MDYLITLAIGFVAGGVVVGAIVWRHMKAQIVAKLAAKANDVLGSA